MRRALREVLGGREAGERAEVVVEMRLIEVAAGDGDVAPVDVLLRMNEPEHALEPLHAAVELRRQSDFAGERLDETALAPADVARGFGDRARARQTLQRVRDRGLALARALETREERALDDVELLLRRRR